MDDGRVPPISAEAALDVVQALGALTSETPGQRDFGDAIRRQFFEELPKAYSGDQQALIYIHEVLAAVAAAVRGFSVERTRFKAAKSREHRIQALRERILEPRFFSSPFADGKGATAFAVLVNVLPASAVLWLRAQFEVLPPVWLIVAAVLWLIVGNVIVTTLIAVVQVAAFRLAGDAETRTAGRWKESMPRYKAMAVDLLLTVERLRGKLYPATPSLLGPVDLSAVPAAELSEYLLRANDAIAGRSPAEALSRIVDLHFGLDDASRSRYVR